MRFIFIIVIVINCINKLEAQDIDRQRREFAAINIGLNGIVGGVGALINKKDNEKPLKVFVKGFGQGCLGGAFQVLGKELTYQIYDKENLSYAWAARISNAVGSSIAQNAVSNINFWERWHLYLGFVRVDYFVKEDKFRARLFPSSIYGAVHASRRANINWKKTLQTGIMIYERTGFVSALGTQSNGLAMVSSIAVNKEVTGKEAYGLMAHEVVHILQFESMVWGNSLLDRLDVTLKSKNKFYKEASKYIYFDLNGLTILGWYHTQLNKAWECRFLEREADLFSRRIYHPSCN